MDRPTFEALGRAFEDPLVLASAGGELIAWSPAAEAVLPRLVESADAALRIADVARCPPRGVPPLLERAARSADPITGELTPLGKGGETRQPVACTAVRMPGGGGGPRLLLRLGTADDDDERRALSEQADEHRAIGRVATAVAEGRAPDDVFELVCAEAAKLVEAAGAAVFQRTDGPEIVLRAAWSAPGAPAPPPAGALVPVDPAVADMVAGRGGPVRTHTRDQRWRADWGDIVSTPIVIDGRPWGVLVAAARRDGGLAASTEARLLRFAELVGMGVANADARRAVIEKASEQAALRRVATAVAADAEPEAVFELISREAAELLGAPAAGVLRLVDDRRALVVANVSGSVDGTPPVGRTIDLGDQAGRVASLRRGAPARLAVGPGAPEWLRAYREALVAPIVLGEQLWGILGVATLDEPVDDAGVAPLGHFADLAGVAVAGAEARRRSVDDAASSIAGGGLDMTATLDAIVGSACRALGADRVTCVVLDADGRSVEVVATTATDRGVVAAIGSRIRDDEGRAVIDDLLASEETMILREDARADPAGRALAARAGVGASITVRLEHRSLSAAGRATVLGLLAISFAEPRRFSSLDRATARSTASIAELALANSRLHARTLEHLARAEEQASIDPLTGLANHRIFHERLRTEVERARRHGRPLAIAVFDLDHFKDVNDRHGHQVGDAILAEVARRLAAETRPEDLLARIGGEEFAWLLPESDSVDAWQASERARQAVRGAPFAMDERCTLSAGVAELSQAEDASDLVRLADGALYWAKAHGRDVSFRYSPDVVEELSAQDRADRLERSQALNAIRVLARAVDAKDPSTRRHSERVAELAELIARELGWSRERLLALRAAGLVHDVGKIGVPDSVLFKPGHLSAAEYEQVKQHARLGAQIVADVLAPEQVGWVRSHHERIDGSGYPEGLAGDAIPMGARILAVADAWDVMTSARPYSAPISPREATAECAREAGRHFCPAVVSALERLVASGAAPTVTVTEAA